MLWMGGVRRRWRLRQHMGVRTWRVYLLDHGAMVNHRDRFQDSVLHYACKYLHYARKEDDRAEVVWLLLHRGADVSAVNDSGDTPLIHAAHNGGRAVVRALLEHGGSDVDATDKDRRTACHSACRRGYPGVLTHLLEAGADPTLRDKDGHTSLDHAAGEGHQDCIRVLQEWHRAYTLYRTRRVRDASMIVANSSAPVDAAPMYLVDRVILGLTMPTGLVNTPQQHGSQSDDVGEEGYGEVDGVAVGGVVTMYALEELIGDVLVELMGALGHYGLRHSRLVADVSAMELWGPFRASAVYMNCLFRRLCKVMSGSAHQ